MRSGGRGWDWSGKVRSGAARFGQAVGVRFGKLGMSRRSMAWIGGLG